MVKSDSSLAEVQLITQLYQPLANSTSKIYFAMQALGQIHYLYSYSLEFYMEILYKILQEFKSNVEEMAQLEKDFEKYCKSQN